MKKVSYLLLVVLFATSCATGYYAPHNVNQFGAQTHVVLDKPNFRIVKNIEVVIDVNNTNLKRADVEKSAYAELLSRANLKGSQALINVVIEEVRREKKTWGVPKIAQHVAARATVIEFINGTASNNTSEVYDGSSQSEKSSYIESSQSENNKAYVYEGSAPRMKSDTISIPNKVITKKSSKNIARLNIARMHGIVKFSSDIPDSTNVHKKKLSANDIVDIPDEAFFKAILKKVDTNKDGMISKMEAMKVTKMNLFSKGIKDMTGIEEFENLTFLEAEANKFIKLDLRYNTKIEWVYIKSSYIQTVYLPEGCDAYIDVM